MKTRQQIQAIAILLTMLFLGVSHAQNEIAWELTSSPIRQFDPNEDVQIADGFAFVAVGDNAVGVYELASGSLIRDIQLPPPRPTERRTYAAADGILLVTDTIWAPNPIRGHSRSYVYEVPSGKPLSQLELREPTLRVGLGASMATDGEYALLSSIGCLETCFDPVPEFNGIVDVFDVATGRHVSQIVGPDETVFAQGLDVANGMVAVSARSTSLDNAGKVMIYDAGTGDLQRTISPAAALEGNGVEHGFGFDIDLDGNNLAVGDNPDLLGHGVRGDGKGKVRIYDVTTGKMKNSLSADDLLLAGTPQLGRSVALDDTTLLVSAPANGQEIVVTESMFMPTDTGACPESFTTGGPCFQPPEANVLGEPIGTNIIIDIPSGGILTRPSWTGGDSIAIGDGFAVIQSVTNNSTSVYAISLAGFLPNVAQVDHSLLLRGDLDDSGKIGFEDFLVISDNFGKPVIGLANGDINQNGEVDFTDFLVFADHFGEVKEAASIANVPEPAKSTLSLALLFAAIWHRRRKAIRGSLLDLREVN